MILLLKSHYKHVNYTKIKNLRAESFVSLFLLVPLFGEIYVDLDVHLQTRSILCCLTDWIWMD